MFQLFCVICMSPHLRFKSLMCCHCCRKIFPPDFRLKERMERGVRHFYFFEWNEQSDLASRSLIYFLKNKPRIFFEEFVNMELMLPTAKSAVVPSCSGVNECNHAKSLAEALMKQNFILSVLEAGVVKGVKLSQQKQKTREQRLKSNTADVSGFRSERNWIFVDDALVSGGTFKSVSEAMFTKPKAVFTLFYKPHLKNKGFYDA